MKNSGAKGIGGKSNPNNMAVFNAIKNSAGKSSGKVNPSPAATKKSAGKSSGGVNKPQPKPGR